jgi:GGDEF domain-containing protein
MIERWNLHSPGVVALVACALLISASAASAAPARQPSPTELWNEFPLDPNPQRDEASANTSPGPSSAGQGQDAPTPSETGKPESSAASDSDSDSLPLPLPVLIGLSLGALILVWLLVIAPQSIFGRSRSIRATMNGIGRVRERRNIAGDAGPILFAEAALHGGDPLRGEMTDDVSAATAPAAEPPGSDRLLWLSGEVERARRGHEALSLLLVRSDHPAGDGSGEDVAQAVASAIEDVLHDVPLELRRDGEVISVVLPRTLAEGAKRLAERVRLFLPVSVPETRTPMTLRTAVACFPRDALTAEELLQVCKQALGRGRRNPGD